MARNNRKIVPESREMLKQMQFEIAAEFGLYGPTSGAGADTEFASELGMLGGVSAASRTPYLGHLTSRDNGSVGGEITKRLVKQAEQALFS
ncbi:alpha/beta-type small acid-soluble spore protein [Paenibacillus sp. 7124]|uniref:Alpha/beta-type small acid-soluble spore protein n=1 Tax=Paenibacillus apii TaxID=1850370 RepID=A0A6M1PIX8_9BACL|nr:alpha/beta-type small acid-soluble spore protein [Paenibacillus apii]NGM82295.1 alpha/beta-type small acid-soluble spore protein [Paenibacillus apii]NJJ39432.1 alpha/beta-type small acid-soluble spore protein [Paenibacillus apii]